MADLATRNRDARACHHAGQGGTGTRLCRFEHYALPDPGIPSSPADRAQVEAKPRLTPSRGRKAHSIQTIVSPCQGYTV